MSSVMLNPYTTRKESAAIRFEYWLLAQMLTLSAKRTFRRRHATDLAGRDRGDRPVVRGAARLVAAVGRLVGQGAKAEGAPRDQPGVDWRPNVDASANDLPFVEHAVEQPLPLEQGNVEERLVVEPKEVDRDEGDRHLERE